MATLSVAKEGIVDYNRLVGERLRAIRIQRSMSLQDVQRATDGEFKAAVLGAYERGERSVSVSRLHRLAECYEVPTDQLLPELGNTSIPSPSGDGVTIDLGKIESLDPAIGAVVDRFLSKIQIQRQDFNGKVLTIRGSDVAMLAMLLDVSDQELVASLVRG